VRHFLAHTLRGAESPRCTALQMDGPAAAVSFCRLHRPRSAALQMQMVRMGGLPRSAAWSASACRQTAPSSRSRWSGSRHHEID